MIDYTVFYKEKLPLDDVWEPRWDLLISSYNLSDRVLDVFSRANADEKRWLVLPDYDFDTDELPPRENVHLADTRNEADYILDFFGANSFSLDGADVCVDITGFLKPYMMFLLKYLKHQGVKRIDVLFSEPAHYVKKEDTSFSDEKVQEVRQVQGFEGIHDTDTSNDILIVGAGYDHKLMMHVAESKDSARKKIRVFGFPSLRPDMYQQNILRSTKADDTFGSISSASDPSSYFAPANDPFVTASVLHDILVHENGLRKVTNLYLSPLATKPQALGFTLFYLFEMDGGAASMIYPFCPSHSKKTSEGISRVWRYTIEFPR